MSEDDAPGEGQLKEALATPVKRIKGKRKAEAAAQASPALPLPPPPSRPRLPETLPDDSPVKALGTCDGVYYYLDSLGQMRAMPEGNHGRCHIISLFGSDRYLKATWPVYEFNKVIGEWQLKNAFDHGVMASVLMESCTRLGLFDPQNDVRGTGSWAEDDGSLVMHCGERLFIAAGNLLTIAPAGVRAGILYPRRPRLPEPDETRDAVPGPAIKDQLLSWNWKRGDLDAGMALGWLVCANLGQALPWRPVLWVTGARGTGKSKVVKLFAWALGKGGAIKPEDTSPAFIYQKLGLSSLPVLLDEFEAEAGGRRREEVIKLMRIAASGGEVGRGGSEDNPKSYFLKSCFAAFGIHIPLLEPQDASRVAILILNKLSGDETEAEANDGSVQAEYDRVLGYRDRWARLGRQLRARILRQWSRFNATYNAYVRALLDAGHDARGADQFGSLGAGYDIAMFDTLDAANVAEWAQALPASRVEETRGYDNQPESCLQYLLGYTPDLVRQGTRETVAHYLRQAMRDRIENKLNNVADDANRILAKMGVRLHPGPERTFGIPPFPAKGAIEREIPIWWIEISNTHRELMKAFEGTVWKGKASAKGGWAQALGALEAADPKGIKQVRIDNAHHWVTRLTWAGVFPPGSENEEDD